MISLEKIPENMKVLNLHGVNDLRLDMIETPKLDKNSVLVKIKYCGICSSDIERVFKNGTYHFPTVIGHEFSGVVVGVNEEDENLLNKKVAIFPLLPCNKCEACKSKRYAQCSNYNYFGSRCDGGFSEYLVVPKWNLIIDDELDYRLLALCEPAAVALHAVRKVENLKKRKILIMGSGTIGLLIGLFLKEQGNDVFVGARRKEAMDFISSLGLSYFDTNQIKEEKNKYTDNKGFSVIYEVIGSNESIETCLECANNFSQIVVVGNPKEDLNIKKDLYWKVLRKELTLTGTWNSSFKGEVNDWQDALTFMKNNQQLFLKLISHEYKIDDYQKAFKLFKDKKFKIKVMIEMGDKYEER